MSASATDGNLDNAQLPSRSSRITRLWARLGARLCIRVHVGVDLTLHPEKRGLSILNASQIIGNEVKVQVRLLVADGAGRLFVLLIHAGSWSGDVEGSDSKHVDAVVKRVSVFGIGPSECS